MALRNSQGTRKALNLAALDLPPGGDTLFAVVAGAVLATAGGLVATLIEGVLRRRERERGAAVLFGEILSAIARIVALTVEFRGRGDPYGPITMRMLRAVRREAETYDRNRESLYEIRNSRIRAEIHALMVRITLTLEGLFDATQQINMMDAEARSTAEPEAQGTAAPFREIRDSSFDFLLETVAGIRPILDTLRPLAKEDFGVEVSNITAPGFIRSTAAASGSDAG